VTPPDSSRAAAGPAGRPEAAEEAAAAAESPQDAQVSSEPAFRGLLDDTAIRRALMRIAHEIVERHDDLSDLYLVAIPNGGVPLGRLLVENISTLTGARVPLGILDTTLYRDDVLATAERPPLRVTEMPSSVDDRLVVLVEDVVNTGRTIRAAMDALMDFGRPRVVQVVALVDRGHRELPIKIDFVGKNIPTQPGEKVRLTGRDGTLDGPLEVRLEWSRSEAESRAAQPGSPSGEQAGAGSDGAPAGTAG
jgi:pyrimidine operon attenuation protein/uracil phosphoribosyltransferase